MDARIWIMVSILVLLVIGAVVFWRRKDLKKMEMSALTKFAFVFIVVGIVFTDNAWFSYGMIGVGVVLAVVDMIMGLKKK